MVQEVTGSNPVGYPTGEKMPKLSIAAAVALCFVAGFVGLIIGPYLSNRGDQIEITEEKVGAEQQEQAPLRHSATGGANQHINEARYEKHKARKMKKWWELPLIECKVWDDDGNLVRRWIKDIDKNGKVYIKDVPLDWEP